MNSTVSLWQQSHLRERFLKEANGSTCFTCKVTPRVVSAMIIAGNCNSTDTSGGSEYVTAMCETITTSSNVLASTSHTFPSSSNVLYAIYTGQKSSEYATTLETEIERPKCTGAS